MKRKKKKTQKMTKKSKNERIAFIKRGKNKKTHPKSTAKKRDHAAQHEDPKRHEKSPRRGVILTRAPPRSPPTHQLPAHSLPSRPTKNPPSPLPSKPTAATVITSCDTDPAQHYLLRGEAQGTANQGPTQHRND